jgi:hypothetical protein
MLIRRLKWKGFPMWPPQWRISDQGAGEEGVLAEAHLREDLNPKVISIVADHGGDIRKGIIALDNPVHLRALYSTFRKNLGRPLAEIGDLEISLLPSLGKRGPRQVRPALLPFSKPAVK